ARLCKSLRPINRIRSCYVRDSPENFSVRHPNSSFGFLMAAFWRGLSIGIRNRATSQRLEPRLAPSRSHQTVGSFHSPNQQTVEAGTLWRLKSPLASNSGE